MKKELTEYQILAHNLMKDKDFKHKMLEINITSKTKEENFNRLKELFAENGIELTDSDITYPKEIKRKKLYNYGK